MCGLALSVETTEFLHRLRRRRTTGLSSGGSLFVGVGGNARLRIYPCSRADSGWVRGEGCWGWVPRVFSREPAASLGGLPGVAAGPALAYSGGSLHAKHPLGRGLRVASGSD